MLFGKRTNHTQHRYCQNKMNKSVEMYMFTFSLDVNMLNLFSTYCDQTGDIKENCNTRCIKI